MADTATPASRRAILAGALGAAVASVASSLGRPSPASAVATPLYIDQWNPTSLETSVETSAGINFAFVGSHLGSGTGIHGYSSGGNGVYGWTQGSSGAGVSGNATAGSGLNHGLYGQTSSTGGRGVTGRAFAGSGAAYGVHGQSDSAGGIGVYGGAAAASGDTRGVVGVAASQSGIGVYGLASSVVDFPSTGVHGQSDSPSGRGGYFQGGDLGVDGHAIAPGGTAGVRGTGTGTFTAGVHGWADGTGAHGVDGIASASSGSTAGVYGKAFSVDGSGVVGFGAAISGGARGVVGHVISPDGTGVQGYSGTSETVPAPSPKTAVYGYATLGTGARGVYGRTTSGQGVRGQATTGTAGYFSTPVVTGLHTGTALQVVGRVKFDRCVGIATIANGASATLAISPGIDLTATSVVTATLMGSAGAASTVVGRVAVNTTSNTFIVHLNSANTSGAAVKVGWHVFG